MHVSPLQRRILQAAAGIGIGAAFLWLAFRHHSWSELKTLTLSARPGWIAAGIGVYLGTMLIRALRWQLLLRPSAPRAGLGTVGETLVLGYAVNNLLPARLGELFRADYAKRRLGISRSAALGSIFVERAMDGLTVVTMLACGLLCLEAMPAQGASARIAVLWRVVALGAGLFGAAGLAALLLGRRHADDALGNGLRRRLNDFRNSVTSIHGASAVPAALLSPLIWLGEAGALLCVLMALGTPLGLAPLLVVTGAVSLSTLVPSAPGYLGTFQYAFYLALSAVGASGAVGVVAATLVQIFLFGGLTAVAAAIHVWNVIRRTRGTGS